MVGNNKYVSKRIMKTIGLTTSFGEGIHMTNNAYVNAFTTKDTTPIIIPMYNIKSSEVFSTDTHEYLKMLAQNVCNKCDALVLTGGNDINPISINKSFDGATFTNYNRDAWEMVLVNEFVAQNKPVVGICRGFQLLGVMYGLELTQELNTVDKMTECHNGNNVEAPKRDEPIHEVTLHGDLKEWAGVDKMIFNSFHHEGFILPQRANDLEFMARTEKVLECFRHTKLPIMATQNHPEELDKSWMIKYILEKYLV